MSQPQPPLFSSAVFAKVFTLVLAAAVAGIGAAIWFQGGIAVRDVVGTLISALIFAYWVHLLVLARQHPGSSAE